MTSLNPFGDFRKECQTLLADSVKKAYPSFSVSGIRLNLPPAPDLGELASTLSFEISETFKEEPREIAEKIVKAFDLSESKLVKAIDVAGSGYINFYANFNQLSVLTLKSVLDQQSSWGYLKSDNPVKVIVEHTSANPAGPIHIGTARNSVVGDALARMLKARGHEVSTHFYVDDVGRQVSVVAYGYRTLGQPEPRGKMDYWVGNIYAITSCLIKIQTLKKHIKELKRDESAEEELKKAKAELDDWVAAAVDLHEREPEMFETLLGKIERDEDPDLKINLAMRLYEEEDSKIRSLFRKVVDLSLQGFKQTYERFGIEWDCWDWESDLVWSGAVADITNRLRETRFTEESQGTLVLDVEKASHYLGLKEKFKIAENHTIPPLTLTRSDGTTLYTTRDIAYSLWKFKRANRVFNVIGVEQSLAQLQLRVAVSVLTSPEKAENLVHYAYELVEMPGYRMSRRRGRYVTLDEVMDEGVKRAFNEVEKRSPHLSERMKKAISESVGLGAIKYSLVNVTPLKKVVFDWEKALNFDVNSAPFIQYAYARACNILKKADKHARNPDYTLLKDSLERDLVKAISLFPEVFVDAVNVLEPNQLAEYVNDLAAKFNSFYAKLPVLKAETQQLRDARLDLVEAFKITVGNTLNLLGIETLERM